MHFTAATLLAGLILGSIGVAFFTYGKRAGRPVHLACGAKQTRTRFCQRRSRLAKSRFSSWSPKDSLAGC